jgi:hypothetical protein
MAHTASCGRATTPTCRCGGCAGSRHGWPGALMLAQPVMSEARTASRRVVEQAWADASKPRFKVTFRFRLRPLRKQAKAAVDCAKDDIENWLADTSLDPPAATAELVSAIGDVAATDILDALCAALGPANSNKNRAELAKKHFFCQLLAEVACSMQNVRDEIDRAVKRIAAALVVYYIGGRRIETPPFVAEAAADAAAKGVDKVMATVPAVREFDDVIRAVRILALMTCPAPDRHEAVIRCALKPLGQPIVSDLVQDRLKTAMPAWMAPS